MSSRMPKAEKQRTCSILTHLHLTPYPFEHKKADTTSFKQQTTHL